MRTGRPSSFDYNSVIGDKYGRLTIIGYKKGTNGRTVFECKCDCGNIIYSLFSDLKNNRRVSCGCYNKEKEMKHNQTKTRLYKIWIGIRHRCSLDTVKPIKNYAERGITVCDEWALSFEKFRDWALSNGYRDDLTIDRIEVNGNYEPSNCRWITKKEQLRNKRCSVIVNYKGDIGDLADICEKYGVRYSIVYHRIKDFGYSIEDAIEKKTAKRTRYCINGVSGTMQELCDKAGLSKNTVKGRLYRGWDANDAFTIKPNTIKKKEV